MAVRSVLRFPHRVLQTPAHPIGHVDEAARALANDLVDTMRASPACVGLAAPQIGVGLRAIAVDVTGHRKARSCNGLIVLFDPEIVSASDEVIAREGCMSVPDLTGDVGRAADIVVSGRDPSDRDVSVEADAFEARALLHEIDHLDGKLFLDRVRSRHELFRRKVYR